MTHQLVGLHTDCEGLNPMHACRCPPGHGDIYPSLLGSNFLDSLLKEGIKYLFVSNSDNLGATLDLDLLAYFAGSGKAFLMEVRLNKTTQIDDNPKRGWRKWQSWGGPVTAPKPLCMAC